MNDIGRSLRGGIFAAIFAAALAPDPAAFTDEFLQRVGVAIDAHDDRSLDTILRECLHEMAPSDERQP